MSRTYTTDALTPLRLTRGQRDKLRRKLQGAVKCCPEGVAFLVTSAGYEVQEAGEPGDGVAAALATLTRELRR